MIVFVTKLCGVPLFVRVFYLMGTSFFLIACTKPNHLKIEIPNAFVCVKKGSYCAKKEFDYIVFMSFPYESKEERTHIEDMLGRANFSGDVDVKIKGVGHINMKMKDLIRESFSSGAVYGTSKVVHIKEGCYQVEVRVNQAIPILSRVEIGVYAKSYY